MNASELRIGNFVQHKCGAHYKISAYDIVDVADGTFYIKPIPLTEEWLLRLGFIKPDRYMSGGFMIDGYEDGFFVSSGFNFCQFCLIDQMVDTRYISDNIKYVHQLQNLYFALTGEELTIKE